MEGDSAVLRISLSDQCFELVEFRLNVGDIHFRKGQLIRGYRLPALDLEMRPLHLPIPTKDTNE